MNHTYTPLIIEGKIYVVVDAPKVTIKNGEIITLMPFEEWIGIVKACTKYETLPEHASYWKERIGQRLTHVVTNDDGVAIPTPTLSQLSKIPTSMKYKVHQKDGKLWLVNDTYEYPTLPSDELHWLGEHGEHGEFEMGVDFETVGNDAVSALLGQAYAIPPQKDPLVNMLVTASVGTQSQHDTIQAHMDEYFKRWPSYKDRLTELEWYHLFLDFSDKLAIPPQQKQGDEWDEDLAWRVVIKKVRHWHRNRETIPFDILFKDLKSHFNLTKK